ncbi:MAG: flagellar assembly protein FliX [Geminicoccaceae bacterium]
MRVTSATGPPVSETRSRRHADATTAFSLARPASAASGSIGAATLGLLALQDLPATGSERRRRAVRRGRSLLERLAEVQAALLSEIASAEPLRRLRLELDCAGDAELDVAAAAVIRAIEVRCAVELAKADLPSR